MAQEDIIPRREDNLPPWFNNFSTKLPSYATLFGLTVLEVGGVSADNLFVQAIFLQLDQMRQEGKEWTTFKDTVLRGPDGVPTPATPAAPPPIAISTRPPNLIGRTRRLIQRLKRMPGYTVTIGEDLGIIGPEAAPPLEVKPTFDAEVTGPFEATLDWVKGDHDGVIVECQRAAETAWTAIARANRSPTVDDRPPLTAAQPEQRRYRLRYFDDDVATGMYSDVASVVVGP